MPIKILLYSHTGLYLTPIQGTPPTEICLLPSCRAVPLYSTEFSLTEFVPEELETLDVFCLNGIIGPGLQVRTRMLSSRGWLGSDGVKSLGVVGE